MKEELNYETMMETLKGANLTMGVMIKLQRSVGKKAAVLNASDKEIAKMSPEAQMEHQLDMMEVLSNLIYICIGSPKSKTPDDIADLIPFDKVEEVSVAIGDLMGQADKTKKN